MGRETSKEFFVEMGSCKVAVSLHSGVSQYIPGSVKNGAVLSRSAVVGSVEDFGELGPRFGEILVGFRPELRRPRLGPAGPDPQDPLEDSLEERAELQPEQPRALPRPAVLASELVQHVQAAFEANLVDDDESLKFKGRAI